MKLNEFIVTEAIIADLKASDRDGALRELVSDGWRRAWEKLDRANAGFLGDVERAHAVADQVAVDWRKADLTERQRAMLAFAVKLATTPAEVVDADLEALRGHGFSDDDIWDIGSITALFALSNRVAHLSAMRPNEEFYLMGRVPKEIYSQLQNPV